MYRVTQTSVPEITHKKAPLNRLIRDAGGAHSRDVRESTPPTLGMLREALFFCPGPAPEELEAGPRRLRNPLEPGIEPSNQSARRRAKG
jgi:hypothetical protein